MSRRTLPAAISTRAAVTLSLVLHAALGSTWLALESTSRTARAEAAPRAAREVRLVWTAAPVPMPTEDLPEESLLDPPEEPRVEPRVAGEGRLKEPPTLDDPSDRLHDPGPASNWTRRLPVVSAAAVARHRTESRREEPHTASTSEASTTEPGDPTPPVERENARAPPAPDDAPHAPSQVNVKAPVPSPDNPPVLYPGVARRRGYEGRVVLVVSVDEGGRPLGVAVAESSGHDVLDRAARHAVSDWRFRPATEDGAAVAGEAEVSIRFQLRDR